MNTKRVFLKLGIGSISLACALLLLMHTAVPRTQAAKGFDKESITGAYAYAADGFLESNPNPNPDFGPMASDYAPVAVAGLITFDGKGQFHIVDTLVRHVDQARRSGPKLTLGFRPVNPC